jgi:hypothetical protein
MIQGGILNHRGGRRNPGKEILRIRSEPVLSAAEGMTHPQRNRNLRQDLSPDPLLEARGIVHGRI